MTRGKHLGELEQLVVLGILRLGTEAYGMQIRREIVSETGRDVAIGAIYSALDRMERKGLVSSSVGEARPRPGGRARRVYEVEPAGRDALSRSLENLRRLSRGVELEER